MFEGGLRNALHMAHAELFDRHRDNLLGWFWLFAQPLAFIFVLTFVFSQFMGTRLAQYESPYAYSQYLVPGVLFWNLFSNITQRVASLFQEKAGLIKKNPVALSALPIYLLLVEGFLFFVSMVAYAVFLVLIRQFYFSDFLQSLILVPLVLAFSYGAGLVVAVLSSFLPDLRSLLNIVLQLAFWGTPVVYVESVVPESVKFLFAINPMYWAIDAVHLIFMEHKMVPIGHVFIVLCCSVLLIALALHLLKVAEKPLRDIL